MCFVTKSSVTPLPLPLLYISRYRYFISPVTVTPLPLLYFSRYRYFISPVTVTQLLCYRYLKDTKTNRHVQRAEAVKIVSLLRITHLPLIRIWRCRTRGWSQSDQPLSLSLRSRGWKTDTSSPDTLSRTLRRVDISSRGHFVAGHFVPVVTMIR